MLVKLNEKCPHCSNTIWFTAEKLTKGRFEVWQYKCFYCSGAIYG